MLYKEIRQFVTLEGIVAAWNVTQPGNETTISVVQSRCMNPGHVQFDAWFVEFAEQFGVKPIDDEKVKQLREWEAIESDVKALDKQMLATMFGIKVKAITRYLGGGVGYEFGPPVRFVRKCKTLLDSGLLNK
jgi:hypothetical protein